MYVNYRNSPPHTLTKVMSRDINDLELAGLTEAELEELSEFIDPDVSTPLCTFAIILTFCT